MKTLYLIGGTMGVGKTTVCRILRRKIESSVFLDGDWCWYSHPFIVTEETKALVLDNICHVLNNDIRCSLFKKIIFCWVMHEQSILDEILSWLDTTGCRVLPISLICSPEALTARLSADISGGIRQPDVLERSLARLPLYDTLKTVRIDTSAMTPDDVAEAIRRL